MANLLEKLVLQNSKKRSLSSLFSIYSVFVPIFMGVALTCLAGGTIYWISDHAFHQAHQNWVDMFTENIRQDIVKGNHPEVFRKCKKFSNNSDEVLQLVVKDSFGKIICDEGKESGVSPSVNKIYFDSTSNELAGTVEIVLEQKSRNEIVVTTLALMMFGFSILTLLLLKVGRSIQNSIIEPFVTIHDVLRTATVEGLTSINLNSELSEIIDIELSLKGYGKEISRLRQVEMKNESLKIASEIASQVAHDIRSPLTALNMVSNELKQIPEEKRLLIRNSIQRINDIANDLLSKGKKSIEEIEEISDLHKDVLNAMGKQDIVLLAPLIEIVVSEKRIQCRDQINIKIEAELQNSFGCFVKGDSVKLKRLLSNLINNSIEAFVDKKGEVLISLKIDEEKVVTINLNDNGRGIPLAILSQLGQSGFSHGKNNLESGHGLGVYHAKKSVEEMRGKFKIASEEMKGTQVSIELNRAVTPEWFLQSLDLFSNTRIYCLDDDSTIHQLWRSRLEDIQNSYNGIKLHNFTSAAEFKKVIREGKGIEHSFKDKYLIDYELLNQGTTGLEIIEELDLRDNVVLVTSRYEDLEIRNKCKSLKIKLLPKPLAGLIPIVVVSPEQETYDWVLIDDDELIHIVWNSTAVKHQKNFIGFKSYDDFLLEQYRINRKSVIFIDVKLANNVNGQDVAIKVFRDGFFRIYLATGYEADQVSKLDFIQGVLGKEPPLKIN